MHTLSPHPRLTEWDLSESGAQELLSQQVTQMTVQGMQVGESASVEAKEGSTSCTHFQFLPEI